MADQDAHKMSPPNAVHLEPVLGCPLRCPFCGMNAIEGEPGKYQFIDLGLATRIADEIARLGWTSRIEIAMRGEPTLHPEFAEFIRIFRSRLPKNYMLLTTNGAGLRKNPTKQTLALFEAGLSSIALDDYGNQGVKWAKKIMDGLDHDEYTKQGVAIHHYPVSGQEGNPHHRYLKPRMILMEPPDSTDGKCGNHALNNAAGNGLPASYESNGKRCARLFREIVTRIDGSVVICCLDWRGTYPIGNIKDTPLDELWTHPRYMAVRRSIYNHGRIVPPCLGCNQYSTRVGLMPDRMGRETMGEFSRGDFDLVKESLDEGPISGVKRREWEKD